MAKAKSLMVKSDIKVGKYTVSITHPAKIIFPCDGISKAQVIDYYYKISSYMLRYGKKHLISMVRYPENIDSEGFYQKNAGEYFPLWITRKTVTSSEGKDVHYVVLDKQATIVYLANQMCLTPHIWLSTMDALNYPDRMIFDLDPVR